MDECIQVVKLCPRDVCFVVLMLSKVESTMAGGTRFAYVLCRHTHG